jgi:hypothetical protein
LQGHDERCAALPGGDVADAVVKVERAQRQAEWLHQRDRQMSLIAVPDLLRE